MAAQAVQDLQDFGVARPHPGLVAHGLELALQDNDPFLLQGDAGFQTVQVRRCT
jgi:hypothetical protein